MLEKHKPVVQRQITTRVEDLYGGGSLALSFDRSSYARIVNQLKKVKKIERPSLQELEKLELLINEYVGDPDKEFHDKLYTGRKVRLQQLLNEISDEKAPFLRDSGQAQAQERYLKNVKSAGGEDPHDGFALAALTPDTKRELGESGFGQQGPQALAGARFGLTSAEIVAIQTFTSAAGDYGYINPATQNNPGRLNENKENDRTRPGFVAGASDEKNMEEGQLHAAMAIAGMKKLPAYQGTVWRGMSFSQADFNDQIVEGQTFSFTSLASASKAPTLPTKFAQTTGKQCGVVLVIKDCGGRDINDISLVQNEKEVALLPSTFTIASVREIPLTIAKSDATALYEVELTNLQLSG